MPAVAVSALLAAQTRGAFSSCQDHLGLYYQILYYQILSWLRSPSDGSRPARRSSAPPHRLLEFDRANSAAPFASGVFSCASQTSAGGPSAPPRYCAV